MRTRIVPVLTRLGAMLCLAVGYLYLGQTLAPAPAIALPISQAVADYALAQAEVRSGACNANISCTASSFTTSGTITGAAIAGTTGAFSSTVTITKSTGTNAIAFATNGSRMDLGLGASDFLYSDSTNVITGNTIQSDVASGSNFLSLSTGQRLGWTTGYIVGDGTSLAPSVGWFPVTDNALDLGSTSKRWANIYVQAYRDSSGVSRMTYANTTNTHTSSVVDGASAIAHKLNTSADQTTTSRLLSVQNNGTERVGVLARGKLAFNYTDSSGSPGAATINKPTGTSAVAASAGSVVITTDQMTTTTQVFLSELNADATCVKLVPTKANGSFTVTCYSAVGIAANATATTAFEWWLIQP